MSTHARCPSCGRTLAVNPDGSLRAHRIFDPKQAIADWRVCPGRPITLKPATPTNPQENP